MVRRARRDAGQQHGSDQRGRQSGQAHGFQYYRPPRRSPGAPDGNICRTRLGYRTVKMDNRAVTSDRFSVITDGLPSQLPDIDPEETREWLDSLDAVINAAGRGRARFLMLKLLERARERQVGVPALRSTDYINTIPPEREPWFPGDEHIERRIRAFIRWNAAIMVARANRPSVERRRPHRHVRRRRPRCTRSASTTSSAARTTAGGGDQVFFQGHASPGIYARAFLEGRLTERPARRLPAGAVRGRAAASRRTRTRG